jgi:hypothetical protein
MYVDGGQRLSFFRHPARHADDARLRFDAMTQFGPAAILTSDGQRFAYSDLRSRRFLTGETCERNIARFLEILSEHDTHAGFYAAAGMIGEYIFSEILVASQVAMTTNVGVNVTSISLTPGDWDITSSVVYNTASTTSVTFLAGAINTNTAALPTAPARGALALITQPAGVVPGAGNTYSLNAARRYSLAATTTVYLVARALFTLGTLNVFGFIGARRAR